MKMNLDLMVFISRDNLPKTIKNGTYVIYLDEYANAGAQWIALYVKNNEITYFDYFDVEHRHKTINIFRIQADNSIVWGYFCIGFIGFMFAGRSLFSPYYFMKNDKTILTYYK